MVGDHTPTYPSRPQLLQHLALKVGVVAERDLARACRDAYGTAVSRVMWGEQLHVHRIPTVQ